MRFLCFVVLALTCSLLPAMDLLDAAREVTKRDMGEDAWTKLVKDTKAHCEQRIIDSQGQGDMGQYLNDALGSKAGGADKDVKKLKELVAWVALYREFNQPPHSALAELGPVWQKHEAELLKNFSWELLQAKVAEERQLQEKLKAEKKAAEQKAKEAAKLADQKSKELKKGEEKPVPVKALEEGSIPERVEKALLVSKTSANL